MYSDKVVELRSNELGGGGRIVSEDFLRISDPLLK